MGVFYQAIYNFFDKTKMYYNFHCRIYNFLVSKVVDSTTTKKADIYNLSSVTMTPLKNTKVWRYCGVSEVNKTSRATQLGC